jgi:signal transduction histidine kinase
VGVAGRLPEPVEVAAYYVVCEALANIGKHAKATEAAIDVDRVGDTLVVEILDNGIGGADPGRGTGLRGLTDRVEALGGRLRVSTPSGHGTLVRAEIPCFTPRGSGSSRGGPRRRSCAASATPPPRPARTPPSTVDRPTWTVRWTGHW